MDLLVQMLPASVRRFSTHMDFVGQQKAERVMQVIIVISAAIGFAVGFWFERVSYMVFTIMGGTGLAGLVILPPWPCFKRNPLNWQPPLSESTVNEASSNDKKKKKH